MSDQDDRIPLTERSEDPPGPTTDGVQRAPRGNPEVDQESVDKGVDQLERVKAY